VVLLSFRVANHRSFRAEQELLLLPAYDKHRAAVPVAAVYGANASGKSNVLDALRMMRTAVLDSFSQWGPLGGVPRDPFALARAADGEESRFGVDLLLDGQKYVYGFALNDERVTEEWLYHYPRGRRRVLFERGNDEFRYGDSLRGPKNIIEDVTRTNSLFLSAAAHHRLEQVLPIYSWFSRQLRIAEAGNRSLGRRRTLELLRQSSTAPRVMRLLRAADLGIDEVQVRESHSQGNDETAVDSETEALSVVADATGVGKTHQAALIATEMTDQPSAGRISGLFSGLHRRGRAEIAMVRQRPEGPVSLSIDQESNGTRTWFDFLGLIIDVLDNGWVIAVDELDASLHPLLVRVFVRLFQNPETNPKGAQLIFTTHDTSLLARHDGMDTLRRDEIWFTEKDSKGETQLYPLTDFKPRSGLNWERRYLGGSMGAVPFLDESDFAAAVAETSAAR
jgi:uncharacterized protein